MPRPPLPLNTLGTIASKEIEPGVWRSRARYRGRNGITVQIEKRGNSKGAAERAVKTEARDRSDAAGSDVLTPASTLEQLTTAWLASLNKVADGPQPDTIDKYRTTLAHINDLIGGLRLREITPGRLEAALLKLPSPDMRRKTRSHLVNMFNLALLHEAVVSNPAQATTPSKRRRSEVVVIEDEEMDRIRERVRQWCVGKSRSGPKNSDMVDLVDLLLATGCRIGEILALRWADCDLSAAQPTVSITGIVVYQRGIGNVRVDRTKTRTGIRTFVLPSWAAKMLRERKLRQPPNQLDAIFVTRNGTWHSVSNMQRRWRAIRDGANLGHVKFHSFRKTVATQVDREFNANAAARLLGHTSERITETHYIKRAPQVVDVSAALEGLAPKASEA